jgi:hypothetical protein
VRNVAIGGAGLTAAAIDLGLVDEGGWRSAQINVLGELVEGEQAAFGRARRMDVCCRTRLCS